MKRDRALVIVYNSLGKTTMLTAQDRATITATIPLLEREADVLATHFYNLLLARHPQLLPWFDPVGLASGEIPRALARGMLLYARHINVLERLSDHLSILVNRHVALQVRPEHYRLARESLLEAMAQVFGARQANAVVMQAWAAAYDQLVDILITAQAQATERLAARRATSAGPNECEAT